MRRAERLLLAEQTDRRLAGLAAGGSDAAFEALLRRHRADMVRAAARTGGLGVAQDAAQVAAASAWKALRAGVAVEHPHAWLVTIAARAAHRMPMPISVPARDEDRAAPGADEVSAARGELAAALSALAALPARQREALLGTAVEGRSAAAVGAELGLGEAAVRQLVRRARSTLRGAVAVLTPTPLLTRLLALAPDAERAAAPLGGAAAGGFIIKAATVMTVGVTVATGAAEPQHAARAQADNTAWHATTAPAAATARVAPGAAMTAIADRHSASPHPLEAPPRPRRTAPARSGGDTTAPGTELNRRPVQRRVTRSQRATASTTGDDDAVVDEDPAPTAEDSAPTDDDPPAAEPEDAPAVDDDPVPVPEDPSPAVDDDLFDPPTAAPDTP